MLKRHEIQVLRRAGHTLTDIATRARVSVRSVQRVETEPAVTVLDADARQHRAIGRPSKAEPFRTFVMDVLAREPTVLSVELLRRAKLDGFKAIQLQLGRSLNSGESLHAFAGGEVSRSLVAVADNHSPSFSHRIMRYVMRNRRTGQRRG